MAATLGYRLFSNEQVAAYLAQREEELRARYRAATAAWELLKKPDVAASRLLTKPDVSAYLEQREQEVRAKYRLTTERERAACMLRNVKECKGCRKGQGGRALQSIAFLSVDVGVVARCRGAKANRRAVCSLMSRFTQGLERARKRP